MSTDQNIFIHPFSDFGLERLVKLTKSTYPVHEISQEEYLGWEYIKNPDGLALISVAESKNIIVSQYAVLPRNYLINGRNLKGSLSVNTITHPHFRRKNLFNDLAKETFRLCKAKDIHFTLGFPNEYSTPAIRKKSIFHIIGHLPLLIRPVNGAGIVYRLLTSKRIKRGDEITLEINSDLFSETVSNFDFADDCEIYERFLSEFAREKNLMTHRDMNFLKWRYINIPFRKYHILKSVHSGRMTGFAIFRAKYIYGLRCGLLVDFCHISGIEKNKFLLRSLNSLAKENNLDLIIATVPAHSTEYNILRHTGFFSAPASFLPQKLPVIMRKHSPDCPEEVTDLKRWFLTFGDYDIF